MTGRAGWMFREGALWGGALMLVLALHLGGALWILHQAQAAAPPGLPEPVFVDLAPAEDPVEEVAENRPEPVEEMAQNPVEPERRPEPEKASEPPELPPLPELEPLEDMADLFPPAPPDLETPSDIALDSSARPLRRPPEPKPQVQREPEPRREARQQPEPRQRAEPRQDQQPAPPQQTRRAQQGQERATGRSGTSARQIARDEATWKQQVGVCLLRAASRVSGAQGARGAVNLVIARNGRVQSASLAGSTGNARVDREIQRAMGRARCPAAPPSLTNPAYPFQQPFNIR